MPKRDFFRSSIVRGIEKGALGVDRDFQHDKGRGVIKGYAVVTKGRLNAGDIRDWEMDDISLDQVVKLGNTSKIGLKSRFGHPNISAEALGTFLGRAKDFRRDGDVVRADLYFDETAHKTPNGDLATYVQDLAANDPDAFGSSLVFDCEFAVQTDPKDGTPKKDGEGKDLPLLVRFTKLFASDVVDDPAATTGMFGKFFNSSVELSAKATEFLDQLLNSPEALDRVMSFLERYRLNRDYIDGKNNNQLKKEEVKMEPKDITLEVLKKDRPDLVSSIELEAAKGERARVLTIVKASHVEFKEMGMEALAEESIEKGLTVDATLASMRAKRIVDLNAKGNNAPGPDGDAPKEKTHLEKAKDYQNEHKCSITEALQKTAPARKQ